MNNENDRDFEVYFVVSLVYNAHFRDYAMDKVDLEWLNEWDCRYMLSILKKMKAGNRVINRLSVSQAIKRDPQLSEDRSKHIIETFGPLFDDTSFSQSALDCVIPIMEIQIGKNLATKALLKAQELIDSERVEEAFKLFEKARQESIYQKPEQFSFWEKLGDVKIAEEMASFKRGVPTGVYGEDRNLSLQRLDQFTYYKGIGSGQLFIILGLSSVGKTTFMLNVAAFQMLCGYNVDLYSLEMNQEYSTIRFMSLLVGEPTLQDGTITKEKMDELIRKTKEIEEKFPSHGEMRFFYNKAHELTPGGVIQNLSRSSQNGHKVDVVYVDYVDIMGCERKFHERRHEIGYNTEELRDIGREFDCGMVTASQSNRVGLGDEKKGFKKKIVDRSNVSEDFSKVFTCDMLISINSEKETVTTIDQKEEEREKITLFIDKNRYGPEKFSLYLDPDRDSGRFFDPTPRNSDLRVT